MTNLGIELLSQLKIVLFCDQKNDDDDIDDGDDRAEYDLSA